MTEITNPHYTSMPGRFAQFRKHLGLSQKTFGEQLGFDQTAISAMEKGKQDITIRTVYRLMDLDCNPAWLLTARGPWQLSKLDQPGVSLETRELSGETQYIIRVPTPRQK